MSYIGTSTVYSVEWVVERLREIQPRSIIDVGCGWGRWGCLAREFLELWEHRYQRHQWAVRIDALDVHPGTWTPLHRFVYDDIFQINALEWVPVRDYDVAICCDVIEHMPKDQGKAFLARMRRCIPHVLVGIPIGKAWPLYGGFDGNEYAGHLARWEPEDFDSVQAKMTQTEDGLDYGLFHLLGGPSV